MKFIAGGLNGKYLRELAEQSIEKTEYVQAAIAYASGDPILLNSCFQNGIKLDFWGRYDETLPVSLPILKKFLDKVSIGDTPCNQLRYNKLCVLFSNQQRGCEKSNIQS